MRLKILSFLALLLFSKTFSQLTITEVYFDTPYNESLKYTTLSQTQTSPLSHPAEHHRGEFVEIYNYSNKDINLKGWYLRDFVGTYFFPADKIIKSGDFLVVAYGKNSQEDYFPSFFSTTVGKENKILYQPNILLRNKHEKITLGTVAFKDQMPYEASVINYGGGLLGQANTSNYQPFTNPNLFYTVSSLQWVSKTSQDNFDETIPPNPLSANNLPPIQDLNEILLPIYYNNYSYLDWSDNVMNITENICQINIEKTEQTPSESYTGGSKCFSFDSAGNQTDAIDCSSPSTSSTISNGYSSDQLDEIKNSIVVFPNPTSGNVTIKWSGVALNKIYNLQVYTSGGNLVFGTNPSITTTSVSFTLENQLSGVFVANFTLNTGQVVSKNILKW